LALLALKSGAPVVFGRDERTPEGHVVHFGPIIDPPEGAEREEAVREFTAAFDRAIESGVRARPEQWFWMHKRWDIPKGAREAAG
jgi:KDO2-lipid IV(A) lauroyltransferase